MDALSPDAKRERWIVGKVAYAIGKVIAAKTVELTPKLASLDDLGRVSAVHDLATRMAAELDREALAAVEAYRAALLELEAAGD